LTSFRHVPHPHVLRRKQTGPVKVADQLPRGSRAARFNTWLALKCTSGVGTMWCAYAFAALALVSLPAALASHNAVVLVSWVSQTFLQLVLLSVIIVGQNVLAAASDKRAEATFLDAEAVLHEALEIQRHLKEQDEILDRVTADAAAYHSQVLAQGAAHLDEAAAQHQLLTAQSARQHEELKSRMPAAPAVPPAPASPARKPAGRNT
jgi:hypothetical protein